MWLKILKSLARLSFTTFLRVAQKSEISLREARRDGVADDMVESGYGKTEKQNCGPGP